MRFGIEIVRSIIEESNQKGLKVKDFFFILIFDFQTSWNKRIFGSKFFENPEKNVHCTGGKY